MHIFFYSCCHKHICVAYIASVQDAGVSWSTLTSVGSHSWSTVASSSNGQYLVAVASTNLDYVYTSSVIYVCVCVCNCVYVCLCVCNVGRSTVYDVCCLFSLVSLVKCMCVYCLVF